MKRILIAIIAAVVVFGMAGVSSAFYMGFEEGLGNDGGSIVGIPGVTFTNSGGLPWVYGDMNYGYNVTSVDTGATSGTGRYNMYGEVFAWLGTSGNWGRIDFADTNGTWFQTGVSSATNFTVAAYDASDNLLDSASTGGVCTQWEGYTDMCWLRVDATAGSTIAYVILSDSGNYWEVDEMTGDMEGGIAVPEPATLVLLGSGLIGLAIARRRMK